MNEKLDVEAIRMVQHGRELFVTAIKAGELLEITKVNHWKPDKENSNQGYQREVMPQHMRKIGVYLHPKKENILPPAIILAAREKVNFVSNSDNQVGRITYDKQLWVIDGQHRLKGLEYAINTNHFTELNEYPLPVVIINDFSRNDEMAEFYTVNSSQKGVKTDLVYRILTDQAQDNNKFLEIAAKGEQWKVLGTRILDKVLRTEDHPWEGKIKITGIAKIGTEVLSESAFTSSLKPLFSYDKNIARMEAQEAANIILNYWRAIDELCPDAIFEPKSYLLQKTPGVYTLHKVLPHITALCWAAGGDFSKDNMKTHLEEISEMKQGDKFWEKDNIQGAAIYGSMKGFALLAESFIQQLSSPPVKL